ncbi:hypothetical protein AMECASPLE_026586 [Ameca splendens]|uniref:Uncharacterized protein n=1 Tax=Ameca splendens TaxID=208324 RepID=A0ABV0Y5J3_9TELE
MRMCVGPPAFTMDSLGRLKQVLVSHLNTARHSGPSERLPCSSSPTSSPKNRQRGKCQVLLITILSSAADV